MTMHRHTHTDAPSSRATATRRGSAPKSFLPLWGIYGVVAGLIFWRLSGLWLPLIINLALFLGVVRLINSLRRRQAARSRQRQRRKLQSSRGGTGVTTRTGSATSAASTRRPGRPGRQPVNPPILEPLYETAERPRRLEASQREVTLPFETPTRPLPTYDPMMERQPAGEGAAGQNSAQQGATGHQKTGGADGATDSWQAHLKQLNARIEESRRQMEADNREQLAREARERHIHQELKARYPDQVQSQEARPQKGNLDSPSPAKTQGAAADEGKHPVTGDVTEKRTAVPHPTGEQASATPEPRLRQAISFSGKTTFIPASAPASATGSTPDSGVSTTLESTSASAETTEATKPVSVEATKPVSVGGSTPPPGEAPKPASGAESVPASQVPLPGSHPRETSGYNAPAASKDAPAAPEENLADTRDSISGNAPEKQAMTTQDNQAKGSHMGSHMDFHKVAHHGVPSPAPSKSRLREAPIESDAQPPRPYRQPPMYLLQRSEESAPETDEEALLEQAILLEETLESFGVKAKVNHVTRGPAITRFELQPERGVKVSKITGLSDDIALNMAARTIRIEAPIPGKAAIGIELPNEETATVSFREMVDAPLYHQFASPLPFALGKNIAGEAVVFDLTKAPHLLIAGATGSGKSVCINTLILSILYSAHPDQVKLLLIDPKVVELNRYNGIPHLMAPVVSDPKKATAALKWAVKEMEGRYQAFAEKGVRDIAGYNSKTPEDPMYWMVIIIDELADLMMVAAREVEDSICRLAQMARAAGIHLVIATQRPSVDVITGLIKANIPSRIAFSVASQIDSRTILDMAGAEKLLGRGDMLFYPVGASQPMRVQGAFLTDDEVMDTVNHLRQFGSDNELEKALQEEMRTAAMEPEEETETESEEVFEQALRLAFEQQQISISMLQRKLRMGFNRAARLIDEMEEKGYVGPSEGTKPRKVISATGRVSPQEGLSGDGHQEHHQDQHQENTDIPMIT